MAASEDSTWPLMIILRGAVRAGRRRHSTPLPGAQTAAREGDIGAEAQLRGWVTASRSQAPHAFAEAPVQEDTDSFSEAETDVTAVTPVFVAATVAQ